MNINVFILFTGFVMVNAQSYTDTDKHEWNNFKIKYSKEYKNLAEELSHMNTFIENKQLIENHNKLYKAGLVSYEMGENKLMDLSETEFIAQQGGVMLKRRRTMESVISQRSFEHKIEIGPRYPLPKSIDWRDKGAVSEVRHQGGCNSCYAFSSLNAIESHYFLKTGNMVSLSPQNIVDCAQSYGSMGCTGGDIIHVFQYVRDNGINTDVSYPYKGFKKPKCTQKPINNANITIRGYVELPENDEEQLQMAIAEYGPVAVCIDASHKSFQLYKDGIYYEPDCGYPTHAMLAVGFGTTEDGEEYYILKNSFGTHFGEKGYMKLARNRNNHCGIATYTGYPLV